MAHGRLGDHYNYLHSLFSFGKTTDSHGIVILIGIILIIHILRSLGSSIALIESFPDQKLASGHH